MKTFFWKLFCNLELWFCIKKSFISLEVREMWKKNKNKIPSGFSKKNNICQNSQERSVREIGTLARVLSWKIWLKNVILVRKRFLMVPQLESISWCLFQKTREDVGFHIRGLKKSKSMHPIFLQVWKNSKIMNLIFCKLKKSEKTWI